MFSKGRAFCPCDLPIAAYSKKLSKAASVSTSGVNCVTMVPLILPTLIAKLALDYLLST